MEKIGACIHVRNSELCDNRSITPGITCRIKKLTLLKALSITHCSITLHKKSEKILTKQRKNFTFLGCYTACVGSDLLTFQDSLLFPVQGPQRPNAIPLGLLYIPEEGRPELQ